jgi:fatty-acid desaturase
MDQQAQIEPTVALPDSLTAPAPGSFAPGRAPRIAPESSATVRLPLPDTVEVGKVLWVYAIPIVSIHLLALAAVVPWLFSWTGLVVMIVGVHVFGQAINVCYHRQLTHRSFKTPKWFEHLSVLVALCCMQDTPGRWVATHRFHHQVSDERPDPHSPLVNFLWAHVGWLMLHNHGTHNLGAYQKYARDVLDDPFYMRLEKNPLLVFYTYLAHAVLYFAVGYGLGWLLWGGPMAGLQFGLSLLVWGVIVRTVAVWHITWSVNSLTHLFGYRNYQTGEHSTNNWLVALLTVGEGWHNNHHYDQASASNQHRWWELDVSYYEIRLLQMLGIATNVVPPKHHRRAAAEARQSERMGTGQSST